MFGSRGRPTFDVRSDGSTETLVAGFAEYGLAGLTAVDYLVRELDLEQTGHISVDELPAVTPFSDGTPRRHTRLYTRPDLDVSLLVGELVIPLPAAEAFGAAILEHTHGSDVEEVVVLSGVPVAHGPEDHRAFYVASEDYQRARLADVDVTPMSGGILGGVNGELMQQALDSPLQTCILTTPVHAQVPDVDAALLLIEALDEIYDLGVDVGPLEEFAEAVAGQYEELAAHLEAQAEEAAAEDRMYM